MSIELIEPADFDVVSKKLREFFELKKLIEVPVQHRLSILAACEDPTTVAEFQYAGSNWPLPQTGQMWLEYELLKNPSRGYFCYSTSYRQETAPIIGRHNLIFPMFEFELPGGLDVLKTFEQELLTHLGFGVGGNFPMIDYGAIATEYGVKELDHSHEEMLYRDLADAVLLCNFPIYTSPFWNMRMNLTTQTAHKVDVILCGIETIGSAERSCDPVVMRDMFHTISDGQYAELLYNKFGRERVEKELEQFLSYDFVPRCGGGIGINRLIRAMKIKHLI